MKRILLAGATLLALTAAQPTLAADAPMARKSPAPAALALFNWSGFHIGLQAGYGWGRVDYRNFADANVLVDNNILRGGFFGAKAGYDIQTGSLVLGILAEINTAGIKGNGVFTGGNTGTYESSWFGSVNGRIGFAANRTLFYAVGGFAFADFYHTGDGFVIGSRRFSGWTGGVGIEHAFAQNWTGFVEYRRYDFGRETFSAVPPIIAHTVQFAFDVVKGGISYKF